MSVILSMIAVMVMKWVLSRYILANRAKESASNTGISTGYAMLNSSKWTIPSNFSDPGEYIDGKLTKFNGLVAMSGGRVVPSYTLMSGGGFRSFSTNVADDY